MHQRLSRLGPYASRLLMATPLLAVFTLWGCPGELDDPNVFLTTSTGSGSCADLETELFPQRCAQAFCHNADDEAADLDLVSPGLPARVVNVASSSDCGGDPLADPSDPKSSVLYVKLTDSWCGASQMPISGDKFTEAELLCVEQWIGSLPSGSGGGSSTSSGMGGMGMGGMGSGGMGGGGGSGGMGGN